ncbi:glycosyltransferase [Luedemannella flava]
MLLTRDDEAHLADCLSAVRPFVDEIVVRDLGSTDRTVEIARAAGAVVVEGGWDGDFGAARSEALSHVTAEWTLALEPDEVAEGNPMAMRGQLMFATRSNVLAVRSGANPRRGCSGPRSGASPGPSPRSWSTGSPANRCRARACSPA